MIKETEATDYLIPIVNTPTRWKQVCEIPVKRRELIIPPRIIYLNFPFDPGQSSEYKYLPLDIQAGGEDIEEAQERIRTQMIHRLETSSENPNSPWYFPNASLVIVRISQYFRLKV